MSGDEVLVLLIGTICALRAWFGWFRQLIGVTRLAEGMSVRIPYIVCWFGCFVLLWFTIRRHADPEVRAGLAYQVLFVALWGVTLAAGNWLGSILGIDAISVGILQRNRAIPWAVCGSWIGLTLCVAGSNIGSGPTIYTTIGPMLLATGVFCLLWTTFVSFSNAHVHVGVDRDVSSGVRLGGLLTAWGLILGRAVAGDWVSEEATWVDLWYQGWFALVIWFAAVVVERLSGPPIVFPGSAVRRAVPAILYVASAVGWVLHLGSW